MQPHQQQLLSIENNAIALRKDTSVLPYFLEPDLNKDFIIQVKKNVNFDVCLKHGGKELSLMAAAAIDENLVLKAIYLQAYEFIKVNFPDTLVEAVSETFSRDLLENNPTWSVLDVLHFFKWVRKNQGRNELKILGNKINSLNLLYMASYYNEDRITEHEKLLEEERKQTFLDSTPTVITEKSSIAKKLADLQKRVNTNQVEPTEARKEYFRILKGEPVKNGDDSILSGLVRDFGDKFKVEQKTITADEIKEQQEQQRQHAAKINQWHKDNEFCINWVRDKVLAEETDKDTGLQWYYTFYKRLK